MMFLNSSAQQYFLAPSLFSRIDCPQKYLYRANSNKQELDIPPNLIGGIRKIRNSYSVFISFSHTEETPTAPSKKAQEVLFSVDKEDIDIILKVCFVYLQIFLSIRYFFCY